MSNRFDRETYLHLNQRQAEIVEAAALKIGYTLHSEPWHFDIGRIVAARDIGHLCDADPDLLAALRPPEWHGLTAKMRP